MVLEQYSNGTYRHFEIPDEVYEYVHEVWKKFKANIVEENRYFSGQNLLKILGHLEYAPLFPEGTKRTFYRARIGDFSHSPSAEMLAPPKRKSTSGRCNPEGISYLYLADNMDTAICEVRPQKGDVVTIAQCQVDLSKVFSFDICGMEDEGIEAGNIYTKCLLLLILEDLSTAITVANQLEYIPLQYIAEFIKGMGYQGFLYDSVHDNGMNIVMFRWDDSVTITKTEKVAVTQIAIGYKPLP